MTQPRLEDYALLADRRTGPLVSRDGSVDWLCLPRFDGQAVFAALLGGPGNGHWRLRPVDGTVVERSYVAETFVLRTRWRTPTGEVVCTDFMAEHEDRADLIRMVEGVSGQVDLQLDLVMRFDYGSSIPWVRRVPGPDGERLLAVSGPDALVLDGPLPRAIDRHHVGRYTVGEGERECWTLTWFPSFHPLPERLDPIAELDRTTADWQGWSRAIALEGCRPEVRRSLLVLRALTDRETGGIAAAPTTSLPEDPGGVRNWDYRYCWLRDSALTIQAMATHGAAHHEWRDWLLRAIAGDDRTLRIMYGLAGERLGPELELDHLPGYAGSRPVRIGNGAAGQYQADVVGEVMMALDRLRRVGIAEDRFSWGLQRHLLEYAADHLDRPDQGIWEMRGAPQHFTHSRVMMWTAFDRGVRAVEEYGLRGPVQRWRGLRDELRLEVEEHGYVPELGTFVQHYGTTEVDASLLVLPQCGFVAWDDPRMLRTVARIEDELRDDRGLLRRYRTAPGTDGLPGEEGSFLFCTFWLVNQYAHTGRLAEAEALFDQVVSYAGDVGLLAEEYDPDTGRLIGNYPQAFSHLGLVQAADAILRATGGPGGCDER
ncbi:glycoside hydrolase family 15 protein [Raineyella sp. LH-20]|uniref:glycoside hydrolase family 15 protein n=1 Tax=Raineyella sp. LH-20 TaxID=3081204 RepID=UPI0029555B6F|nr:glycoside hydrolase family 15 protein [Raineyella sp. LH-20]WOP19259.1 glycoside hydrolase family 15 protein [Raineyella sp. LH-20]